MKSPAPLVYSLRQAEIHIQAGRTQPAIALLSQILKLLPRHPQANSRMGMLLLQVGRIEEAIAYLKRATEAQPTVVFHWLRLLAAYSQSGNVQQAQRVLEQAATYQWSAQVMEQLAKVATEPTGRRQHGLLSLYQTGKDLIVTEIAARFFMDDFPGHPLGWQILGAVLHDIGKLDEALEIKQVTVEKFPKDANAHNNLAHTLLALKRYEQALTSARAAMQLNPGLAYARNHELLALAGLEKETT